VLQQTTIDAFISEFTDRIAAQHARLESFNRLVSHELRQPLGTLSSRCGCCDRRAAEVSEKRERLAGDWDGGGASAD
jgi:signal transduction histidine kinase